MKKKNIQLKNDQRGTLLLISLLILSIVVLSAVIASRLVTREVRLSADIDNSLSALYSSESGVEYGLYEIMVNDLPINILNDSAHNNAVLSNGSKWELTASDRTSRLTKSTIEKDTYLKLKLYNRDDPSTGAGINSLSFDWETGNSMKITLTPWDASSSIWESDIISDHYCGNGNSCSPVTINLNPDYGYYVKIDAVGDSINDLVINSIGADMSTPITIGVTGTYLTSKQAMEVRIPQHAPWE